MKYFIEYEKFATLANKFFTDYGRYYTNTNAVLARLGKIGEKVRCTSDDLKVTHRIVGPGDIVVMYNTPKIRYGIMNSKEFSQWYDDTIHKPNEKMQQFFPAERILAFPVTNVFMARLDEYAPKPKSTICYIKRWFENFFYIRKVAGYLNKNNKETVIHLGDYIFLDTYTLSINCIGSEYFEQHYK